MHSTPQFTHPADVTFRAHGRARRRLFPLALLAALAGSTALAQPAAKESKRRLPRGFISKSLKLGATEYKYSLFLPPQYALDEKHAWPLIVFLHGSGECGNDGVKHTTIGLPVYISQRPTRFPFIVLMPQAQTMWFRGEQALAVWEMLRTTIQDYRVDRSRIYLTGLSMGGFATWELAMAQPDVFAAIVPVCGVGPADFAANLVDTPVWAFHGAQDKNVPVAGSREPINALRRLGAQPRYSEYPDLAHDCWDRAYATPELWTWLLQQRRRSPPKVIDFRLPQGAARVWWLAMKSARGFKGPAHIRADASEDGVLKITSEGIGAFAILPEERPIPPGKDIKILWNGEVIFRGPLKGDHPLTFVAAGQEEIPTSHPMQSADEPGGE